MDGAQHPVIPLRPGLGAGAYEMHRALVDPLDVALQVQVGYQLGHHFNQLLKSLLAIDELFLAQDPHDQHARQRQAQRGDQGSGRDVAVHLRAIRGLDAVHRGLARNDECIRIDNAVTDQALVTVGDRNRGIGADRRLLDFLE